jgi:hypothetical protein
MIHLIEGENGGREEIYEDDGKNKQTNVASI